MGKRNDKGDDGHNGGKNQKTPSTSGASPSSHHNSKHPKRSEGWLAPTSTVSSLISSADPRTLEELVLFLEFVFCALLSGYVFVWAYFIVPTWGDRRLQVELQVRAAVAPSAPVQGVKA